MSAPVVVHVGRTTVVTVSLGYDVSADTLTSQIREDKHRNAALIGEFVVEFLTDGTDGELVLTLDNSLTTDPETPLPTKGYMDIQRDASGEPVSVFDKPLRVVFRGTVTQ